MKQDGMDGSEVPAYQPNPSSWRPLKRVGPAVYSAGMTKPTECLECVPCRHRPDKYLEWINTPEEMQYPRHTAAAIFLSRSPCFPSRRLELAT